MYVGYFNITPNSSFISLLFTFLFSVKKLSFFLSSLNSAYCTSRSIVIPVFSDIYRITSFNDDGDLFLYNFNKNLKSLKNLEWVGYLSATSVYGDHKGEFVNENSELLTKFTRGINRKLAEDQWIDISNKYNLPLHIFRIAGIYGPQRSIIDRMSSGNFINVIKDNHFFSRIYIDDLVNIINASMNKPNPISIYNVADDLPSSLNDVVRYISEKTGIIIDREVQYSELSEDEKRESFFTENKKVNNKLIKEELGVILKYPTYIEGYNKIINC